MRWKLCAAMGWACVGFAMLAGAGGGREGRFRRLVVEDEAGNDRVVLSAAEGVPSVSLYDRRGKIRLNLSYSEGNGPAVAMSDGGDVQRQILAVSPEGGPLFITADAKSVPSFVIRQREDGRPRVEAYTSKGKPLEVRLETVEP